MLHFDTEWACKHLVIIVAVHKMDFEAVEQKQQKTVSCKAMGKNWCVHKKPGTGYS